MRMAAETAVTEKQRTAEKEEGRSMSIEVELEVPPAEPGGSGAVALVALLEPPMEGANALANVAASPAR